MEGVPPYYPYTLARHRAVMQAQRDASRTEPLPSILDMARQPEREPEPTRRRLDVYL